MTNHLQAASDAGFATLNNPNTDRDPHAARLLLNHPAAAGIALHANTLHIATPAIPTPALLADIEDHTGLPLYVTVTTPEIFNHFKATEQDLPQHHTQNLLNTFLTAATQHNATDLILTPGQPPTIRAAATYQRLKNQPRLTTKNLKSLQQWLLDHHNELIYTHPTGRWRTTKTQNTLTFRQLQPTPPTPEDIHIPAPLLTALTAPHGLIVVASPPNEGKTTTLATLTNRLNHTRPQHINVTAPTHEYRYTPNKALITYQTQPEPTPAQIVIIDHPDPKAVKHGLQSALNGQLVLITTPAATTTLALQNLLATLPPEERPWAQQIIANTLLIATAQRLLPTTNNTLTAFYEHLKITPAAQELLRNHGPHTLDSYLETDPQWGQSLSATLAYGAQSGLLAHETAQQAAPNDQAFATVFNAPKDLPKQ